MSQVGLGGRARAPSASPPKLGSFRPAQTSPGRYDRIESPAPMRLAGPEKKLA